MESNTAIMDSCGQSPGFKCQWRNPETGRRCGSYKYSYKTKARLENHTLRRHPRLRTLHGPHPLDKYHQGQDESDIHREMDGRSAMSVESVMNLGAEVWPDDNPSTVVNNTNSTVWSPASTLLSTPSVGSPHFAEIPNSSPVFKFISTLAGTPTVIEFREVHTTSTDNRAESSTNCCLGHFYSLK